MDGDFDQFDDIDDTLLGSIPLDFPLDGAADCNEAKTKNGSKDEKEEEEKNDKADIVLPDSFPFPFDPYTVQKDFMQQLYKSLELGKVGIFESPTGTGKSLSLICGALTWLRDYEQKKREEVKSLLEEVGAIKDSINTGTTVKNKTKDDIAGFDWIAAFAEKQEQMERAGKLKEEQEGKLRRELRLQGIRKNIQSGDECRKYKGKRKKPSLEDEFEELFKDASQELKDQLKSDLGEVQADDDILVAEYNSDDESKEAVSSGDEEKEDEEEHITKIYYCSRTHSQLSQFVREIQKSPFGQDTRVVSLASRQNLCINDAVRKLKSQSMMNDRCQELQKAATKKKSDEVKKRKRVGNGCPFYKHERIINYRDQILVEVKDIEQLAVIGRQKKACPYYGTRYAIPAAQIVALPYHTLLHRATREACGIRLHGNVVVIDEAHNLMETINAVHSIEITGSQVTCAHSQLSQYEARYRSRLKANNLMYIRQILFVLASFIKTLGGCPGTAADQQKIIKDETRLETINNFLFASRLDNINLFKVKKYCEKSLISKKLHSFVETYQATVSNKPLLEVQKEQTAPTWALSKFLKEISESKDAKNVKTGEPVTENNDTSSAVAAAVMMSSPLMHIEGFLEAITTADCDGRIVINKKELVSKSSLKFVLLNPAVHFADVINEARAVIVAGGTMQPLDEFKEQLFYAAGVKPDRILEFTCGHVIPPDHLLPIAMARGSSGLQLDFTYQSRDLPEMIQELGRVVYNLCNVVPGGIVCFFPSYDYEKRVHEHWQKNGFLDKMSAKKKIFREPRHGCQVQQVLSEYTAFIKHHLANKSSAYSGALLLSVVGGKMSEGINFSDDLGRCVVMVGLPYPNIRSPELKEKMEYLNKNMTRRSDGKLAGQVHYENLCMKAVNQSIGRAIRHRNDYATILLLDHRYLRANVRSKLPHWVAKQLAAIDRFGPAFAAIRKFFADKADKQS